MESVKQPDFNDTQLAFAHLSDKQLKRSFRLFKMIDSPFLTQIGPPILTALLKLRLPIEGLVRTTIFNIFCGGESMRGTEPRSAELFKSGVRTILDYSVEGEKSPEGFDATRDEIIRTLRYGSGQESVAFSALKVTGIAHIDLLTKKQTGEPLTSEESARLDAGKARLEAICQVAAELGQPVFIDAEESWIQDVIDLWSEEFMARFNREKPIVFTTIQLYRTDRIAYYQKLIDDARSKGYVIGIKLVRGAYMEKERERAGQMGYPSPIQPDKASTDRDFDLSLEMSVANIDRVSICAGSHNVQSNALLAQLMQAKGYEVDHKHILFAQLLGMSDNISFNLAHHGFNVAKYLPYGPVRSVLPYLFRRAEENTAIGGQASRELSLLKKEVGRRQRAN